MSFPNPDNYARDCDCGTAGANTTPPPATIQADLDSLDTRVTSLEETNDVIVSGSDIASLTTTQQALIREGSIVTTTDGRRWVYSGAGSKVLEASYIPLSDVSLPLTFTDALSGSIDMRGYGGSIDLSSFGGTISTATYGGSITTGTYGGSINTSGYNGTNFGGSINTSGTVLGIGGPINTSNKGGSIDTSGASTFSGGNINLSASGLGSNAPHIVCGAGIPSANLPNGSLFLRIDGTASTTLYVRAAGAWSALS